MTDDDPRAKLVELVKDAHICMLTTMTADGRHVSRPMGVQEAEFDGDLWFFAYADSDKVREIAVHPQVNVSFSNKNNSWVSISGTAAKVDDQAKTKELWSPMLKGWFPDGLDTPGLTLIKVTAESAEYWETAHGKVVTLLAYAKAAVTGKTPDVGDNQEVDLT